MYVYVAKKGISKFTSDQIGVMWQADSTASWADHIHVSWTSIRQAQSHHMCIIQTYETSSSLHWKNVAHGFR